MLTQSVTAAPASALEAKKTPINCFKNHISSVCQINLGDPGKPGGKSPGGGGHGKAPVIRPECQLKLLVPQPPKSDPVWGGHADGAIYVHPCYLIPQFGSSPPEWHGPADPVVLPADLAQQALALLRIPKPVVYRSPPATNSDAGVPYTWVNLWTYYWTSPASWDTRAKSLSLGGVSASVTVKPVELVFDPGNGSAPVSCAGPGRAWVKADGNAAPSGGACGYVYRHVSDGVSSKLSIRWAVSWTGTGGTGGDLPDLTTTTTSPTFKVEQIQVVNVPR